MRDAYAMLTHSVQSRTPVSYTHLVFSDLGTYQPGDGWNVYSEIKRKLTEDYGIPPSEVRFIQECKTDKARKAVIDAMNAGTVRVLFGSTLSLIHIYYFHIHAIIGLPAKVTMQPLTRTVFR